MFVLDRMSVFLLGTFLIFYKIAIQGTPPMAADKEAFCNLPLF